MGLKETRRGAPFPNEKSLDQIKAGNLVFELNEGEDAPSHFAKLLLTDPHFLTGNWLLAGLPLDRSCFRLSLMGRTAMVVLST